VFDFIQQSLRTVAMEFGGALFYVSTLRPDTIVQLRSYILYRLFYVKDHSISSNHFQFAGKPQALERERILIPSGWDSIGKIKITKESFPCDAYLDAENNISPFLVQDYQSVIDRPRDRVVYDDLAG
jgi:dynein light intermediate chain 1, cytosolic